MLEDRGALREVVVVGEVIFFVPGQWRLPRSLGWWSLGREAVLEDRDALREVVRVLAYKKGKNVPPKTRPPRIHRPMKSMTVETDEILHFRDMYQAKRQFLEIHRTDESNEVDEI